MNQLSQVIQELIKTALTLLHWGHTFMTSTKNDQFCDPTHSQKLFSDDRFRKYVTNFNTPPFTFHVNAINVWSLAPQTFKTNHLTYLSVALRFQKTNVQCLFNFRWFSGFILHYELEEPAKNWENFALWTRGWLVISQSWNWKICKISKTEQVFFSQPRSSNTRIDFGNYLFIYRWQKNVLHSFRQKKANYSHFDQDFLYLLGLHLKHSKPLVYFKN